MSLKALTFVAAASLASVAGADRVVAAPLDLTPTGFSFANCGGCTTFGGRGIYFHADDTFSISSVGWVGSVVGGTYELDINAGAGETAPLGSLLASFTQALPAAGYTTNVISAAFTFTAGNDYHMNLALQNGQPFSSQYDFIDWGNGPQSSDLGVLTLLDGTSYPDGSGPFNSWLTHFIFDTAAAQTPAPASLALLGVGLAGIAMLRRRRSV